LVTGKAGVVVNPGTWISEKANDNKAIVWPNIFDRKINIGLIKEYEGEVTIKLFNLLGQNLKQQNIYMNNKSLELDLYNLNSGTYFIHIETDNELFTSKIIKK